MRKPSVESTIDALGTMTIGDQGDAKYFGPSAGSEVGIGSTGNVLDFL